MRQYVERDRSTRKIVTIVDGCNNIISGNLTERPFGSIRAEYNPSRGDYTLKDGEGRVVGRGKRGRI